MWSKLGKALLFPHVAVMILLLPVATAFLVYAMVVVGTETPLAIASYVLSAYTLTVWCLRIPYLIGAFKRFKRENRYVLRWQEDDRLRINVSLFGSLSMNLAYAAFQLWLGFYHHTFWFYSLAAYYLCLAVMRFFLVRYTRRHRAGERMRDELGKYRVCGWIFLLMNLALTLIVFFMVYWNRTFRHHEITAIAMAAYTFASFAAALVSMVRYRKYNSPVYSASKAINFAAACVSMLTLSSTMLTAFGDGSMGEWGRRMMLGSVGGAVSAVVIAMAVYMIVKANKQIKRLKGTGNFTPPPAKHGKETHGGQSK